MLKKSLLLLLISLPLLSFRQLSPTNKELLRNELADSINALRISLELPALVFRDTLRKAADFHSVHIAKNKILSHDENVRKYETLKDRMEFSC